MDELFAEIAEIQSGTSGRDVQKMEKDQSFVEALFEFLCNYRNRNASSEGAINQLYE